jgi:hypothetical protein
LLPKNIKIRIYRIIIFPVVLYGRETGSKTLREYRRLRVFENRLLRRIFEPKKEEVTGTWRRLYNEELKDLYSDNQIKKNEMGVRTEGRRKLGRPRHRGGLILKWIFMT